jgi:hypothetical protein
MVAMLQQPSSIIFEFLTRQQWAHLLQPLVHLTQTQVQLVH